MKRNITYVLIFVLVALVAVFAFLSKVFFSPANLLNIIDQVSIIGIVALGMAFVILTGGIDLSVGSIAAVSGIVLAFFIGKGLPLPVSLLLCAVSGALIGALNGFFIGYGKITPFIVTLGSMSFARGVALFLTDGASVSGLPGNLTGLVNSYWLGIPFSVYFYLLLAAVCFVFLNLTFWGKYMTALGGNERAAWLSGIRVKRYKLIAYVISGTFAAFGSMLLVGKLNSAQPQAGNLYELNSIAAVVIGGASLSGGRASIINTVLGTLILGVLQNGFSILNLSSYFQQIFVGFILVGAVFSYRILNQQSYEKN
jgi:ribose transport system permease protein